MKTMKTFLFVILMMIAFTSCEKNELNEIELSSYEKSINIEKIAYVSTTTDGWNDYVILANITGHVLDSVRINVVFTFYHEYLPYLMYTEYWVMYTTPGQYIFGSNYDGPCQSWSWYMIGDDGINVIEGMKFDIEEFNEDITSERWVSMHQ